MTLNRRFTLYLGPRTIKTGIAVSLSVFLATYVPFSSPILAGTAAVICIQPSITVGLQKGIERTKTTIVAGFFGLIFYYIFGPNIAVLGLAVIFLISLFKKLGWEDGIGVAALTVIAIMSGYTENPLTSTLGRVTSTLIGIGIATFTNIIVAPPRHKLTFRQELKHLTDSFPDLYLKAIEAYAIDKNELAVEALQELEATEAEVKHLITELDYLKTGAESRYGTYLEGIGLREVVLYENCVHFLDHVMGKIRDVVEVAQRRWQYKHEQALQGEVKARSAEFEELVLAIQDLAQMLGKLHQCVFLLIGEDEMGLLTEISQMTANIAHFKEQVRQCLRDWQVEHMQELDLFSLMATHRIIFDLEEITNALTELANAGISYAGLQTENRK